MGRAVGIDLGTTFSTLGVLNEYGKAEIVPNAEGERTTPSVVHFCDDDSVVVGRVAKNAAVTDPYNVVEFIKRQMGNADYVFLHGKRECPAGSIYLHALFAPSEEEGVRRGW
jgi:molecular chaperone DnaK